MKIGVLILALFLMLLPLVATQELATNTPPILKEIPKILVCENSKLTFQLEATDESEVEFLIHKQELFFIENEESRIISRELTKKDVGTYKRTVAVSDGEYVDTQEIEIEVVEMNNAPVIENPGVQTVLIRPGNDYKRKINATDIEDAKLDYTISVLDGEQFIEINSEGEIEFIPTLENQGIYMIQVCAQDSEISIHKNIEEVCEQDGTSIKTCINFELSIVEENRPPTILINEPSELNIKAKGNQETIFNITAFDPDGTRPDIYWYIDRELVMSTHHEQYFAHTFKCGFSGIKVVGVEITDSTFNDSIEWAVTVAGVPCVEEEVKCDSAWICQTWNSCQNTARSRELGVISREDNEAIQAVCIANNWNEDICGFQLRTCTDVNSCNLTETPNILDQCSTLSQPACSDFIKNCHDNSCEFAPDCGGPCNACATCSDGIKNQGEEGVDCGFPCTGVCPLRVPFIESGPVRYITYGIILVLIFFTIYKIYKIMHIKKELRIEESTPEEKTNHAPV